jgi:hypothetical protein
MSSRELLIVVISEAILEGKSVSVDSISYFRGQTHQAGHDELRMRASEEVCESSG